MFELEEVLVPVDFSAASERALAVALELVTGESSVIILQHVIDQSLVRITAEQGFGDEASVRRRLRERAEDRLAMLAATAGGNANVQPLVSEGTPFYEILKVAHELAVDAVVIGKKGIGQDPESVFFGSTAERVVRGCSRPVLVLPADVGG
jgi:nucleotide-binding universal stress UspA family protein